MAEFGLQGGGDGSREVVVRHVVAHRQSVKDVRIGTSQFFVGAILFSTLMGASKHKCCPIWPRIQDLMTISRIVLNVIVSLSEKIGKIIQIERERDRGIEG